MTRWIFMAIPVALLLAGCGTSQAPSAPQAKLSVPACVVAPATVVLDASGSVDVDGDIDRFIFTLGHRFPSLVVDVPRVTFRLDKPYRVNGKLAPLPASVTVVDSTGLQGTVTLEFWLVDNADDCDGLEPLPDVVETDIADEDVTPDTQATDIQQDLPPDVGEDTIEVAPQDVVELVQDVLPDLPAPDVVPDVFLDTGTDGGPDGLDACPTLGQTYTVKVRCNGVVDAVLDLNINQLGCTFKDTYGVIEGSMNGSDAVVESSFTELKIQQCSGIINDPAQFTLECSSGCVAEYTIKE